MKSMMKGQNNVMMKINYQTILELNLTPISIHSMKTTSKKRKKKNPKSYRTEKMQ